MPADSASEIVKFTISIPRESCTNANAKYSSSVVPPDPSVHFYHCQYDITDGREIGNYIYRGLYIIHCRLLFRFWTSLQSDQNLCGSNVAPQQQLSIDISAARPRPRPPTSAANPLRRLLSIYGTDRRGQRDGWTDGHSTVL